MNRTDCHALLLRSTLPGRPLLDRFSRVTATSKEGSLTLRGSLPRGLYQMSMHTAEGTFPTETLMIRLLECPSRKHVMAGPFDFDHTQYKMIVPTFRVFVAERDCGLVWCEVPSPEDMEAKRVKAIWGIEILEDGEQTIRIEIPPTETRLRIEDLDELEIADDDRAPLSPAAPIADFSRPRLFARAPQLRTLLEDHDTVQSAILDSQLAYLRSGADGTYEHRTVIATLAGILLGRQQWIAEAIDRTMRVCARKVWGYHDVPEIMGWNNDRDTGMRLFETAMVYDWLHETLTPEQRRIIREKLIHYAEYAWKTTLLQKNYWYYRSTEAHGHGYWFGFAAAAIALMDEYPRAAKMLDWIRGNVADAARHMPEDGITTWPIFNAQWLILTVAMLERFSGPLSAEKFPFIENFGRNIMKHVGNGSVLSAPLFFLAARQRDGKCQANALSCLHLVGGNGSESQAGLAFSKVKALHPLTLLAYDPTLKATQRTQPPLAVMSLNGSVVCRSEADDARFEFTCGTPLTERHHDACNWIAQAWCHIESAGSFAWICGNEDIVLRSVKSYRRRTSDANLISIDGRGHHADSRWVASAIDSKRVARIEQFETRDGITTCHANITPAYVSDAGVKQHTRQWVFFHKTGTLLMRDAISTDRPRRMAWHIHEYSQWKSLDRLSFFTEAHRGQFCIRALAARVDGEACIDAAQTVSATVETTQWVPSYTYGVNLYKSMDWQPEINQPKEVPNFYDLQFAPKKEACAWELITVMGGSPDLFARASAASVAGGIEIQLPGLERVRWTADGLAALKAERAGRAALPVLVAVNH